ncbi:MAG: glycosyltransferase family 39 protein [Abditibacteriota bacterium]|nr:glycosyltransferase family 39 protein [Abditibacteriota bacterium]
MILSLFAVLICGAVLLAGFACGCALEKAFSFDSRNSAVRFVVNTSLGLFAVSLFYFLFSACGMLKAPGIYVMLAATLAGAVSGAKFALDMLSSSFVKASSGGGKKDGKKPGANKLHMRIFAVITVSAFLCFVNALCPSVSDDWDSLAYHLAVPGLFLEHGGFYFIDSISHSNFPMFQEMLYLPAVFLGVPAGGKLLSFVFALFTVMTVCFTVSRFYSRDGAPVASLAVVSMPIFLWLATTAYIDVATGLYAALAVYFMFAYCDSGNARQLAAAGICLGIEASLKLTGLQFMLLFSLWLCADGLIAKKKFPLKEAGAMLLPAVLICAPWYIKSLIYTGNPVFPFFYGIFGGKGWNEELANVYAFKQSLFGIGHTLQGFVLTPVRMATNPELFYDQPGLYVGPVILLIFPCLCLLIQVRDRKLAGLGGVILLQYIIWFGLTHQSRYLLPMFVCSAVFIASILYSVKNIPAVRGILITVMAVSACLGIMQSGTMAFRMDRFNTAAGIMEQDEYITKYFPPYRADKYANSLKSGIKIALLGDTRGFYLKKPYVWADTSHNTAFNKEYDTPEELAENLLANGCTHAMVSFGTPGIGKRASAQGNNLRIFEAVDKGYLVRVFPDSPMDTTNVYLFKIAYPAK